MTLNEIETWLESEGIEDTWTVFDKGGKRKDVLMSHVISSFVSKITDVHYDQICKLEKLDAYQGGNIPISDLFENENMNQ